MLTTVQNGYIQIAYQNIIGPAQGRAAIAAGTDAQGNPIAAVAAAGDPSLWYVGIRQTDIVDANGTITNPVTPPSGVIGDNANGMDVLGGWA